MAYFSNSSQGECFAMQCEECRYGQVACPIASVQMCFNYEAVGNKTASEILNELVRNDGTCMMFKHFEKDFRLTDGEKAQQELFQ